MGTSLVEWVQALHQRGLFAADARVIGLTSEGNRVAWRGYAAAAAAKAALEAAGRAIAVEFAPWGIRCNIVQPGVTPTPALALIPGHEQMVAGARRRNPFGRLTAPQDVAALVCLLATDEAAWVNGAIIACDGGEHLG
jgi:NAD(P)-dependent dehydrogenase (short-subunit alcohol dehydrogenase family)